MLKRTPETKRKMKRGEKKWRNKAGEGRSESWDAPTEPAGH